MLTTSRIFGLSAVALLLAVGQLLFKLAAERLIVDRGIVSLAQSFVSVPMLAAVVVYAMTTVLWVFLLHGIPLSRAYPFLALAFATVPALSWLTFRDSLDLRYLAGLGIMIIGLYLVSSGR